MAGRGKQMNVNMIGDVRPVRWQWAGGRRVRGEESEECQHERGGETSGKSGT